MEKSEEQRQLKAIGNILGMSNPIPEYRFQMGRYRGRTLEYVAHIDRSYLLWCYHTDVVLPKKVITFIEEVML